MREHYHNLQALRGVACLMVILLHLWSMESSFGLQTPVLREFRWFGFAGVDLFFVLSGFIITATNRHHLGKPAAVPGYLFRRVWRVYPAYWTAMAAAAAAVALEYGWRALTPWPVGVWGEWLTLAPLGRANWFIGQAWTLSYEVMFYLAFGVVLLVPRRLAAAALGGWGAVVVAWLFGPEYPILEGHPVSPFVLEFLGGCLAAWLVGRGRRGYGPLAVGLGVGYAAAAVLVTHAVKAEAYHDAMLWPRLRVLVFGPAAVLVVYGLAAAEGLWPRRVPGWLTRAGDASYSLYLLHGVFLGVGYYTGFRVPHTRVPHLLWLAGTLAAILVGGLLFHSWVERPLLNLAKRRKPDPVPAAVQPELPAPARRAA